MDEVPQEAVVRLAPTRDEVEAVSLVLQSVGISHWIRPVPEGHAVVVATADVPRAVRALDDQDRDVAEMAEAKATQVAAPDRGPSWAGVGVAVSILAFLLVTGPRSSGSMWFRLGSSLSSSVRAGHVWRTVTALTLHSDVGHVVGNAIPAVLFIGAAGRWLGSGLTLWLVLLSGMLGNWATALVKGRFHESVGASTAIFGALGILVGLQVVRRIRGRDPVRGLVGRAAPVIAAGLGVYAMIGTGGENTDVMAHAMGLAFGVLLGLNAALLPAVGRLLDAVLTMTALAAIVGAWLLAFRFPG